MKTLQKGSVIKFLSPSESEPEKEFVVSSAICCNDEHGELLKLVGHFENGENIEICLHLIEPRHKDLRIIPEADASNIIYRVKGLSKEQAEEINKIESSKKIIDRCRAILENATSIEYEGFHSDVFFDNLDIVDSALPKMVADLLKVHYFKQILLPRSKKRGAGFREADRLDKAVELLSQTEPYVSKSRKNYCEIKIKRFLRACALGLMPSEIWDGKDDASGGYIIVLPDGKLVALYVYNTNLFEKYLYETTIFERASITRHNFLTLIPDGDTGDFLLKLNMQIRFSR